MPPPCSRGITDFLSVNDSSAESDQTNIEDAVKGNLNVESAQQNVDEADREYSSAESMQQHVEDTTEVDKSDQSVVKPNSRNIVKDKKRGRPLKKGNVKKGASLPGQMANKMKVPNHQKKLKLGVEAKQKMNQMQKIQTETDLKFLLKSPTSKKGCGRMGRK